MVQALCDGIDFSVLGERARTPAPGICGGATGKPANFFIRTDEGTEIALRSKASSPRLMQGGSSGWRPREAKATATTLVMLKGEVKARTIPGVKGREEGVGER